MVCWALYHQSQMADLLSATAEQLIAYCKLSLPSPQPYAPHKGGPADIYTVRFQWQVNRNFSEGPVRSLGLAACSADVSIEGPLLTCGFKCISGLAFARTGL